MIARELLLTRTPLLHIFIFGQFFCKIDETSININPNINLLEFGLFHYIQIYKDSKVLANCLTGLRISRYNKYSGLYLVFLI